MYCASYVKVEAKNTKQNTMENVIHSVHGARPLFHPWIPQLVNLMVLLHLRFPL